MQQGWLRDLRVDQRRGFSSYQVGLHPTSGRSILRPPSSVPRVIPIRTSLAVKELAARTFRQAEATSGLEESGPLESVVEHSPQEHDFQQAMARGTSGDKSVGCSQQPAEERVYHTPRSEPSSLTAGNSQRRSGEGGLHVFSNSVGGSVGNMTVNNARRDIIVGMDDAEFERRLREFFGPESLPAILRYSRTNGLVLTDALDRIFVIPWDLIPTYEHLASQLLLLFKGRVGERHVSEGRFSIARAEGASGGGVIGPDKWKGFVGGRERVVMSMLIEQILKTEDLKRTCPKCGPTDLGTFEDQGWYVCRKCNLRFIVSTETDYEERVEKGETNEEAYFRHVRKMEREPPVTRDQKYPSLPTFQYGPPFEGYPLQDARLGRQKQQTPLDAWPPEGPTPSVPLGASVEQPKHWASPTALPFGAYSPDWQDSPRWAHPRVAARFSPPGPSRFQRVGPDELSMDNSPMIYVGSPTATGSSTKRRSETPWYRKSQNRG